MTKFFYGRTQWHDRSCVDVAKIIIFKRSREKKLKEKKIKNEEEKKKFVILVLHMKRAANQTGRPAKTHHFITCAREIVYVCMYGFCVCQSK